MEKGDKSQKNPRNAASLAEKGEKLSRKSFSVVYWKSMLEKKRQEKIRTVAELEKTVTEILVANGRSIEPFVKVFSYSDENIAKSLLGTLIGVFEIADQSEDSAYIVNFLASVAKKEYFSNPRRGAVESFEAALHKINLALAELVKHGNIAWLGKFHGALGVLEKSNLHFSVTGDAEIILLRNGSFGEISAGLASVESSLHPIKTFVEISSGRMVPEDKVIFTSPELFGLLSLPDLEKNALRMDAERFAQFLRTVLINELDMAGTLIVDFQESAPAPVPHAREQKIQETPRNVFSQNAFIAKIKMQEASSQQTKNEKRTPLPSEYVDSKTGHIYVQGDTPGRPPAHPVFERAQLSLQDMFHRFSSFFASQKKLIRKGKKQVRIFFDALTEQEGVVARKVLRFLRRRWQRGVSSIRYRGKHPALSKSASPSSLPIHPGTDDNMDVPDFMKEKLATFYEKNGIPEPTVIPQELPAGYLRHKAPAAVYRIQNICQKGYARFRSIPRMLAYKTRFCGRLLFRLHSVSPERRKIILIGGAVFIIALGAGIFFSTRSSQEDVPTPIAETPQPEASALFLETEKNARLLATSAVLATREENIITSVLLDTDIYIITAKGIVNVREDKQYALPAGSGSIRLAAPMDDLRLIFVHTDAEELFAWSPISRTFVKNTLALPAGASVRDIGTYLTYLYVLDDANNQIYRFPRAEGGFGSASLWLKDPVTFEERSRMAISETIFVAPNKDTVQAFFRGKFVKDLEAPNTPLSITHLFTHPGLVNVYALDADNKRILVWSQNGTLIAQYFSEQLSGALTITVNEKTNEAFVTTSSTLLSFRLNTGQ